jgi:hypothetical protein
MRRPVVPGAWRQRTPEGNSNILVGEVVSYIPGSGRVVARVTGLAGKTIKDVVVAEKVDLQQGHRILLAQIQDGGWVAVCRVLDMDEYGLAVSEMLAEKELHPPTNLTVTGVTSFVMATWDCWAGNAVCWEVQHNTTATETGASTRYTYGAYFLYPSATAVTRHIRVRAVRYDPSRYTAYYSRWSAWSSATSTVATPAWENCIIVAKSGGDYTTVAGGIGAWAAGYDMVMVMPGNYAENITISDDDLELFSFAGDRHWGETGAIISGSDDVGPICTAGGDTFYNGIAFYRTLTGGSGTFIAVAGGSGSRLRLLNTHIHIDGNSTGRVVTAIRIGGAASINSVMARCYVHAEGGTTNRAIRLYGNTLELENCHIIGLIDSASATDLIIRNCYIDGNITGTTGGDLTFEGGGTVVTGTISGWDSVTYTRLNQQAHIADADGTLADITTKFNTLLSQLETYGLLATS